MKKTHVIGDVHGCFDQLLALVDKLGPAAGDDIILIGDFVDRGPDSPACTAFARAHRSVMGNHEYKHVRYRDGVLKNLSPSQIGARQQFWDRGIDYNIAVDYMETLPFYMDLPEALLVHAGMEYSIPIEAQDRITLIGGLSKKSICGIDPRTGLPFWCAKYPKDARPIVFGHLYIDPKIPRAENIFPIDTGCCRGGLLTALTLPEFTITQVPGWDRK